MRLRHAKLRKNARPSESKYKFFLQHIAVLYQIVATVVACAQLCSNNIANMFLQIKVKGLKFILRSVRPIGQLNQPIPMPDSLFLGTTPLLFFGQLFPGTCIGDTYFVFIHFFIFYLFSPRVY